MNRIFNLLPENTDAVLITSDINRRYFTGLNSTAGICLMTRKTDYLFADFRYYEKALKTVSNFNIIELKKQKEQLSEIFIKENIKNVCIESDTMTVSQYNKFCKDFGDITFETESLSNALNIIRSVKTDYEVECIIKAQRIAEDAFEKTLSDIKIGMSEKQIKFILEKYMAELGSEGISFETIVLAGENSAMPHGEPSDREIKEGDFLLFDFGATYNGYHSDMTRTVAIGYATEKMKKVYEIVLDAQLNAINNAKADMTGKEVDALARVVIEKAGYGENFGHSLGHSVGLEIHEYPNCSPNFEKTIEKGVIMTVEPGIYLPNEFGIRIEDMVLFTENGVKNLTNSEKSLRIIK